MGAIGPQLEQRMVVTQTPCPARLVPSGQLITIPAHQFVTITQARGGNYTVTYKGNMARIDGTDANALGLEQEPLPLPDNDGRPLTVEQVKEILRTIYDPEIPVNIVDLGLIYGVTLHESASGEQLVEVRMTLTAPACGMGQVLTDDVRYRVSKLPGVGDVTVTMVFDPPWSRDMISDEAKLELGIY
jgi:probable FeS assembly SUF system protein SufT